MIIIIIRRSILTSESNQSAHTHQSHSLKSTSTYLKNNGNTVKEKVRASGRRGGVEMNDYYWVKGWV